jgi:CRISPR-associated protein Cas4
MDGYISFSQLNDFLFSPFSLYLHECYKDYEENIYQDFFQIAGKQAHETIDDHRYKKKGWLTSMRLCSPKLEIYGRTDLYNEQTGELVERKRLIKRIYEGYRMQIYAQYYCLLEMNYQVNKIALYSLADNTKYPLETPTSLTLQRLKLLVKNVQAYQPQFIELMYPGNKSLISIYSNLCPIED